MVMLPRPLRDEGREKGANALGTMLRLHIQLIACSVYYIKKKCQTKQKHTGRKELYFHGLEVFIYYLD
ncbi:hypothetical protein ABS315_21855 [Peribacillus frigoritolerans]|uniref:hypothetical protein n=1 Tax=Peribacillus TaxID=2675229 RepID=UPI000BFE1208|nr:hypothetical protein COF64_06430 [Bacillus sp. AFS043905]